MVSSRSHVTSSSTTWCCHNNFISLTVLPRKTCSRLSMIRTGPSSKVSSASTTSSPQSTTSRIRGVLLEYGIPRAYSTNSVVAPTDMQPCPPCDTNCHTPTFSAQRVLRLTRARPVTINPFSWDCPQLSYRLSITCRMPRSRKASTHLTLQRIFSALLLFGTSHVPLLALVTDSRTALIIIAS